MSRHFPLDTPAFEAHFSTVGSFVRCYRQLTTKLKVSYQCVLLFIMVISTVLLDQILRPILLPMDEAYARAVRL